MSVMSKKTCGNIWEFLTNPAEIISLSQLMTLPRLHLLLNYLNKLENQLNINFKSNYQFVF